MASVINTNQSSLNAQRWLSSTQNLMQTSMARLSSGLRVNSAKDDAAGLAIASKLESASRGMAVGIRNANDAISMAAMAEGALGNLTSNLQRMRELAVQRSSGNISADQDALDAIDAELGVLVTENNRIVTNTFFNSQDLLGGLNVTIELGDSQLSSATLALTQVAVTADGTDIAAIDADLATVNLARAEAGAAQNQFMAIISNLQVNIENHEASRGRIMDADYAAETANLSRAQILQQAGTAMVAQANQIPQGVLSLLK